MTNSKQWELELEEYGSMHNEGCPCMLEDPDGCDCDMNGLKPLFRNAINQAISDRDEEWMEKLKMKKLWKFINPPYGDSSKSEKLEGWNEAVETFNKKLLSILKEKE